MAPSITSKLLAWYAQNARPLPWRATDDPYALWVAEVMLQQTRVDTVIPYFQAWMDAYPTVESLAQAPREQVLRHWEGLGYYQRARNLHRSAKRLVRESNGELPRSVPQLRALPGIGPYTAAALGAIAFGLDVVALDGNLRRVLARLFDIDMEIRSPAAEQRLRAEAGKLLPSGRAGEFNQALMDLGATVCTGPSPSCEQCPLQDDCLAFARGVQMQRPVRRSNGPRPHRVRAISVIVRGDLVLLGRRPEDQLLGGLWEFPGFEADPDAELSAALAAHLEGQLGVRCRILHRQPSIEHGYSHYQVTAVPFLCRWQGGEPTSDRHVDLQWVPRSELPQRPMGKIDRTIAGTLAGAAGG